jgi:ABC-2 type transport system permease protein
MRAIVALGLKDLRLLLRVKARLFFTLIWPLIISVLLGVVFGGPRGGNAAHVAGQPRSGFEVTFIQGMLWGIIGCTMTFAVNLVTERTRGTFVRLQMAPMTNLQILAGKALSCFISLTFVLSALLAIGVIGFGVQVDSPVLLAVAMLCAIFGFVGVMMLVASLGRSEEATSGAGWAVLMPMAMLGGAMVPIMAMPRWMLTASQVSPIKWAAIAFEGAIWRGFTTGQMLMPCALLIALGLTTLAVGARSLR